ncbi:hypothetical protein [Rhodanobacter lindaniclasticus]
MTSLVSGLGPVVYAVDLRLFHAIHPSTLPSPPMLYLARGLADGPLILTAALLEDDAAVSARWSGTFDCPHPVAVAAMAMVVMMVMIMFVGLGCAHRSLRCGGHSYVSTVVL